MDNNQHVLAALNHAIKATITAQITVRKAFLESLQADKHEDVRDYATVDDCLSHMREMLTACLGLMEAMQTHQQAKEHHDTVARLERCFALSNPKQPERP